MNVTNGDSLEFLHEFLNSQNLMTLGTSDGVNLWNACVYFLSDKWLNLYFMSNICAEHSDNILNHPQVALTITDSQINVANRVGIQARGICEKMGKKKNLKFLNLWNQKYKDTVLLYEDLEKHHLCFFKIILTKLKYFNSNLLQKVIEFEF